MKTISQLGTLTLTGITGNKYDFQIYPKNTIFKSLGGVYVFTKRYYSEAGYQHKIIYVGETGDFLERFKNHHRMPHIERMGANIIGVLPEDRLTVRLAIEKSIRQKYNPSCNRE